MVVDDDGHVIDNSPQPAVTELMDAAEQGFRSGHRNPRRVEHADRAWLVTRLRVEQPSPPAPLKPGRYRALVLTVVVPLDPVHAELRALAAALTGLTLAILAIALFASRAVCRRALAPVTQMASSARAMDATDLTHRLPSLSTADELADLAQAFNGLLDRLAEAFERERRFAGEASHQLRTPLAALIGQVEVALRRNREPEEYRRALAAVLDQAGRLRRVVEALLFLARSESDARLPGLDRIDLTTWIPARLRAWDDHPRRGDLVVESHSGEVAVVAHPDLLGELLDALLDNALKYSEPGTPVTIRIDRDRDGAWIEVEDRGCGIAAEDIPNLFRPFFRSDSAKKRGIPGVGLGLAVAARIAAALGSSIAVESELGQGCRMRMRLRLAIPDDNQRDVIMSSRTPAMLATHEGH
jgi:signal transduction histidine kinase